MKSTIFAGAVATLACSTGALAQTTKKSAPFFLKTVSATNTTLDGRFLYACHTGAALESLCIGSKDTPTNVQSATFYWNNTVSQGGFESPEGTLFWDLPLVGSDGTKYVPEPMTLQFNPGTNVAITWFSPGGTSGTPVGFNGNALFVSAYPDDSKFVEGVRPDNPAPIHIGNWHVCWAQAGGYYYNVISHVAAGEPHNPTCQPVGVVKVDVGAWMLQKTLPQPGPAPIPIPAPALNQTEQADNAEKATNAKQTENGEEACNADNCSDHGGEAEEAEDDE